MRLLSRALPAALMLLALPAQAQVSNPAFVGVFSFNGRIGAVSLMAADVTAALGYPPYSALNPAGYQTASQVAAQIATALANTAPGTGTTVSGVVGLGNGGTGATSAAAALTALGAYPAANPAGYQTASQVAAQIATAFGGSSPGTGTAGVLSFNSRSGAVSLLASDITTALNYSPYPATNPAGYQTASQTVALAQSAALVPVTTVPASGTAQTLTAPPSGNAAYDITLTANCSLALSGGTAGQLQTVTLFLRQSGSGGFNPTLPAGVRWPGGTAPTPNTAAGVVDVFTFTTPDAGATWIAGY